MRLLITGGAGYIGAHACIALLGAGHDLVVLDDFSNSDRGRLDAVVELAGRTLISMEADIRDGARVREALEQGGCNGVVHFAALKSVPGSIRDPERYKDVNVAGTSILLEEAMRAGIDKFVFCSSAAVYGAQTASRASETDRPAPSTPYSQTKFAAEQLVRDLVRARPSFRACNLRCFNPIGAHPSGRLGSRLRHPPFDLLSNVLAARHADSAVDIYGLDYDTPDRSAVRDFIHVMDIADGCAAVVAFLATGVGAALNDAWTFNLGTGKGCSVLQLIEMVEEVGARPIRRREKERRPGDLAVSVADPTFSAAMLKWRARRSLEEACADALRSFERHLSSGDS